MGELLSRKATRVYNIRASGEKREKGEEEKSWDTSPLELQGSKDVGTCRDLQSRNYGYTIAEKIRAVRLTEAEEKGAGDGGGERREDILVRGKPKGPRDEDEDGWTWKGEVRRTEPQSAFPSRGARVSVEILIHAGHTEEGPIRRGHLPAKPSPLLVPRQPSPAWDPQGPFAEPPQPLFKVDARLRNSRVLLHGDDHPKYLVVLP
ncbi:hypothetical protein KM043_016387 [Ampulex compressa]|nr:hypothetical protein KM043_016387 [Ampulex compressa]